MWILITYDVNTETVEGQRRLRRMARVCLDYGQRVQKSVFECSLDQAQFERLRRRLINCVDETKDSLRIYRLPESRPDFVEEIGVNRSINFKGPLVV